MNDRQSSPELERIMGGLGNPKCAAAAPHAAARRAVCHAPAIGAVALIAVVNLVSGGCAPPAPLYGARSTAVEPASFDRQPQLDSTAPGPSSLRMVDGTPEYDADTDREVKALLDRAEHLLLFENDPHAAIELLSQAQTIDEWSRTRYAPEILFWLGHAYDRIGEKAAAMSAYRRMLLKYPNAPRAKSARRRLTDLEAAFRPGDEM